MRRAVRLPSASLTIPAKAAPTTQPASAQLASHRLQQDSIENDAANNPMAGDDRRVIAEQKTPQGRYARNSCNEQ